MTCTEIQKFEINSHLLILHFCIIAFCSALFFPKGNNIIHTSFLAFSITSSGVACFSSSDFFKGFVFSFCSALLKNNKHHKLVTKRKLKT